jgi:HlyD family secretion protein
MDFKRIGIKEKKQRQKVILWIIGILAIFSLSIWVMTLEPAMPTVERERLRTGVVERGNMLREVGGVGALAPEEFRWVSANTSGRVERIMVLPGAWVEPDTLLMELSNPDLMQQVMDAKLALKGEEAAFASYEIDLRSNLLQMKSSLALLEATQKEASMDAEINESLKKEALVSELQLRKSLLMADQLNTRLEIEKQRLAYLEENLEMQLTARKAQVDQSRELWKLLSERRDGLRVVAGVSGVLQRLTLEEGMQVNLGESISQVANPHKLKAVIRVPEINARDVQIGQQAIVDTRNGKVRAMVSRVDPNAEDGTVAVDLKITDKLPKGARPDLTVEGFIELEYLQNVVHVRRPAQSRPESTASLFKMEDGSDIATRVEVEYGKSSVSIIEIRSGLEPGDRVVLSSTDEWNDNDKIRIR